MMRSIFILFVMMQWLNSGYGNELFHLDSMSEEAAEINDENDSDLMDELTTLNYEMRTEPNPPISTHTPLTEEPTMGPILMKLLGSESTEAGREFVTEFPTQLEQEATFNEQSDSKKLSKSIKHLENKSGDIFIRTDHRDSETIESMAEDTTTIPDLDSEMNETKIGLDEEPTTVQPPTSKKPKKIEIYKTRPNELLRHYVEDSHLRSPVAALLDKKTNPLLKAKKLWKAALKPNSLLDIMVVSYDSEGIKSTYNLTNTKAMMSTLDRVREENTTTEESKTYYSIIRTGQLIPYDSAIFLSTDTLPNDTEHQQAASMILLKKRIRLYLVIFDEKNHIVNESSTTAVRQTGFLGQLALRTGGDIIYVPNHAFKNDGEMGLITLVVGNRLKAIDSELKEVNENELKSEGDHSEPIAENEETTSI